VNVVDLDPSIAMLAARIGVEERLALADSIVLARSRQLGAVLWTQDADFEGRVGVLFHPKRN